jgi:amino acid adenylation domain-containing protein
MSSEREGRPFIDVPSTDGAGPQFQQRMQNLSEARQALLRKLASRQTEVATSASLDPSKSLPPASFGQTSLWLIDQMNPKDPVYNMPAGFVLEGAVDADVLEAAINDVIARHESLRTTFRAVDGEPRLVVAPSMRIPLHRIELTRATDPDRQLQLAADREATAGFDLSTGPLLRATWVSVAPSRHALLLTLHHSIVDGHSLGVILEEISAAYAARLTGRPADLPQPIQYSAFVQSQRQWVDSPQSRPAMEHFRRILVEPRPVANLPLDHPRQAVQTFDGASMSCAIDALTSQKLDEACRGHRVTPFMFSLAVFALLLKRYCGQDELIIGAPASNRLRRDFDRTVGLLANNLVMLIDLSGDLTFRDLLTRVRQTALQSYGHQALPFEKLLDMVEGGSHTGGNPLFQTYFNYIDQTALRLDLPGVTCSILEMQERGAKHELTCFYLRGEQHRLLINYNSALFDQTTAQRLLGSCRRLLEQAVSDPNRRVVDYDVLDESQHREIDQFNQTSQVYTDATGVDLGKSSLHSLIERQVATSQESPAVADERQTLSYSQLNTRANALAAHLRSSGVARGDMAGVCLERSVELEISLLAVLKAGAAYVPLDPSYPSARLEMMVQDSGVNRILAHGATRSVFEAFTSSNRAELVLVDELDLARPVPVSEVPFDPTDLAYMIYTSGSTGKPKGAMNHHAGIVNRLLWMQERFTLTPRDVVLQKTPAGFDVSVWEFFWPLMAGAKIYMARPGGHQDPQYLLETILREKVTVIHFVPSMLRIFLQTPGVQSCNAQLRCVICSGEALSVELAEQFFKLLPNVELHNLYGPTEAAVDVTHHQCRAGNHPTRAIVSIGKPIANTQIHILDSNMRLLPVGIAGELHIGGIQVAKGYLNRPELTAERFINDPFDPSGNGRLYKSGDLARWLPNGEIEFLGRLDFQVKIRGQRIELGEVESGLLSLRDRLGIKEVAVIARGEVGADQRLVAYVVLQPGIAPPDVEQLHAVLASRLPEVMIPTQFVFLDRLPLSANGKLDRKALPDAPTGDRRNLKNAYVAPGTPLQRILAQTWRQVLKVPSETQIGINDNFFALGGDSILAMQAVARLRDKLRTDVQLRSFFAAPTIAGLSKLLSEDPQNGARLCKAAELLEQIEQMSESQMQTMLKPAEPATKLVESRIHE